MGYFILAIIMVLLIIKCVRVNRQQDLQVLDQASVPYTITVTDEILVASRRPAAPVAAPTPNAEPQVAVNTASRGDRTGGREAIVMECTAYTLREQECGKAPGDPGYGITASGASVEPWHTIAAPQSIPFGTRIYIPYFSDAPNGGVFTVQDRGGAVVEGCLDIYMESLEDALQFGRRDLEVYILGE